MVKRIVAGINVPAVATSAELRCFVHDVFLALNENCTHVAKEIGVTPATIWKLEEGHQKDSQVIRNALDIRKSRPRPRVWMPTNNCDAAVAKLLTHYGITEVIETLMVASEEIDSVIWYGTGEKSGFNGLRIDND